MKITPATSQAVIDGLLQGIKDAKAKGNTKLASQLQNGLIEHMTAMLEINPNIENLH